MAVRWGIRFALLSAALAVMFPGSAVAFGPLASFGEFGAGPGQLDSPSQIAVGPDGDVYVADSGNDRIEVFAGDGTFLRTFGAGQLLEPKDVALDDEGRAFVADSGNHRVAVFSAAGTLLSSFGSEELTDPAGIDVDVAMFGSTVFVADSGSNSVDSFTPAGALVDSFGSVSSPRDVVVGAGGNLFVADFANQRVDVFTKEGNGPVRSIGAAGGEAKLSGPAALAVDDSGGIYVVDQTAQRVLHFSADGGFFGGFAAEPNPSGVAVGCQGNVFAVEQATLFARVQRFGEAGTPPPPCAPQPEPVDVAAPIPPSNRFHFAGLVKNRSNGFATLYVRVPGPGTLNLSGRGFRRLARTAQQATTLSLPVKPKVRLRHFLRKHGKGRIRLAVTFTPVGGFPRTMERVVVLRRHRR
jgi:streptogramin lyase